MRSFFFRPLAIILGCLILSLAACGSTDTIVVVQPTATPSSSSGSSSGSSSPAGPTGVVKRINDNDPSITYNGAWTYVEHHSDFDYQKDFHYTTTVGDSFTLTFTGTSATLLCERNVDHGIINISLDGAFVDNFNLYHAPIIFIAPVPLVANVPFGRHQVTVNLTNQGIQAGQAKYLTVDGFDIGT